MFIKHERIECMSGEENRDTTKKSKGEYILSLQDNHWKNYGQVKKREVEAKTACNVRNRCIHLAL